MNASGCLADALQNIDRKQETLARLYEMQQSEEGQAALKVKKEMAEKMKRITNRPLFIGEVDCLTNIITGEKQYFYKKG